MAICINNICAHCGAEIEEGQRWVREKVYERALGGCEPRYRRFHAELFDGQELSCWERHLLQPEVRTREGQEVELESYGQLQQDGKLQRAVRERMVAGLSTRNYRRAVESVLEGYGIERAA